jgi:DNA-binding MarR family transcriptional regulator
MRRRSSALDALLAFRGLHPRASLSEFVAFLYVCENEGLSVQELAYVSGMSQTTASRNLRALGPPNSAWSVPPALGLVEAFLRPTDGRSHILHLTPSGARLRERLDEIIARAQPIGETTGPA